MAKVLEALNALDGIHGQLIGHFHRPPRPMDAQHNRLFDFVAQCGQALCLNLTHRPTGGCCDGNNLSALGLVTIDTLGVRGGAIHSDQEFALIDSFEERATLSALILMRLAHEEALWDDLTRRDA